MFGLSRSTAFIPRSLRKLPQCLQLSKYTLCWVSLLLAGSWVEVELDEWTCGPFEMLRGCAMVLREEEVWSRRARCDCRACLVRCSSASCIVDVLCNGWTWSISLLRDLTEGYGADLSWAGVRTEVGAGREELWRELEVEIEARAYDGRGNCGQEGRSEAAEWFAGCGVCDESDMRAGTWMKQKLA